MFLEFTSCFPFNIGLLQPHNVTGDATRSRPLVLGHRGASAVAPENTVAAFTRARELGADGVELDVRRTADGVLVVHHDPEVRDVGLIASMTLAELRAARPTVATLAEALDACRGLVLNAEVKCLPWEPDADTDGSVMRATIDAVRVRDDGMLVVSSFDLERGRPGPETSRPISRPRG